MTMKWLFQGEKLLGNLGGIFSKTWKPKKTRQIQGPVITGGELFSSLFLCPTHNDRYRLNLTVVKKIFYRKHMEQSKFFVFLELRFHLLRCVFPYVDASFLFCLYNQDMQTKPNEKVDTWSRERSWDWPPFPKDDQRRKRCMLKKLMILTRKLRFVLILFFCEWSGELS